MNDVIQESRALLRQFERSDYQDIMIRTDHLSLFIARENGGPNPLLAKQNQPLDPDDWASADDDEPILIEAYQIHAPHLASFRSSLALGSQVTADMVIAQLELLGEAIEIKADQAGEVAEVYAQTGDLLEYGMPIISINPA